MQPVMKRIQQDKMLTEEEKQNLIQAFNLAIKSSPDAIGASSVLLPLLQKILSAPSPA